MIHEGCDKRGAGARSGGRCDPIAQQSRSWPPIATGDRAAGKGGMQAVTRSLAGGSCPAHGADHAGADSEAQGRRRASITLARVTGLPRRSTVSWSTCAAPPWASGAWRSIYITRPLLDTGGFRTALYPDLWRAHMGRCVRSSLGRPRSSRFPVARPTADDGHEARRRR